MTDPRCPVCALPADAVDVCPECGWTLRTGWLPGPLDRAGFDRRLADARTQHDLRAAIRAEAPESCVRGIPTAAQRKAAYAERDRTRNGLPPDTGELARRLLNGADVAVVEVAPDAIRGFLLTPEHLDTAKPLDTEHELTWPELLPMLATTPAHRRFQLAGGQADLDRRAVTAALHQTLPAWLASWWTGGPPVVVSTASRWTLTDQAAERLAYPERPHSLDGSVRALLRDLVRGMPLRYDYGLVVLDPAGSPGLRPEAALAGLFPAGTVPGAATSIQVRRPPGGLDNDVTLAVVADMPGKWLPVGMLTTRLTAALTTIDVRLDAPGLVEITGPAATVPETRQLTELMEQIPVSGRAASGPIELYVAVELGGEPDATESRRNLAADFLELVANELADEPAGEVGVALVGYADHPFEFGQEDDAIVAETELIDPSTALQAMHAMPIQDAPYQRDAAPLEDALDRIARRVDATLAGPAGTRPTRRVTMIFASRPPHPPWLGHDRTRPLAQRCATDWRKPHDFLTGTGTAFVTVVDGEDGSSGYWARLGSCYRAAAHTVQPRELAVAAGLLPADAGSFPFPLRGDRP